MLEIKNIGKFTTNCVLYILLLSKLVMCENYSYTVKHWMRGLWDDMVWVGDGKDHQQELFGVGISIKCSHKTKAQGRVYLAMGAVHVLGSYPIYTLYMQHYFYPNITGSAKFPPQKQTSRHWIGIF